MFYKLSDIMPDTAEKKVERFKEAANAEVANSPVKRIKAGGAVLIEGIDEATGEACMISSNGDVKELATIFATHPGFCYLVKTPDGRALYTVENSRISKCSDNEFKMRMAAYIEKIASTL